MTSMSDVKEELEEAGEELEEDPEELGDDEIIEDLAEDDDLDELDDDTRDELKVADEALSQKELNARAFAVRRAIEKRAEDKQLGADLDLLDFED
jgi:hypothetical protein